MKNNEFEKLDNFVKYISSLNNSKKKILNEERYEEMLEAAMMLKELLQERDVSGEIGIEVEDKFSSGSITVELDELAVYNPILFAQVIKDADNFEVYPLTNGKIRFSIMYYRMFKKEM